MNLEEILINFTNQIEILAIEISKCTNPKCPYCDEFTTKFGRMKGSMPFSCAFSFLFSLIN